jgi:hypothetical protein
VYLDTANRRAHVSTTETSYFSVRDWIDAELANFPVDYHPTRATPASRNKGSTKTTATKYSQLFSEVANQASDNSSFDPSTIKTTRSHAWTRRPPMRIEYDVTATAFPPLPKKSSTVDTPITQAVTVESDNLQNAIAEAVQQVKADNSSQADHFQSTIDAAIKQAEATNEEKLQAFTATTDARMTALKASLNTIVAKVVASTYESLHNSGTFVTKHDHIRLQTDVNGINTKLDALIQLIHNNYETDSMTDHDDEYPQVSYSPQKRQDRRSCAATPTSSDPASTDRRITMPLFPTRLTEYFRTPTTPTYTTDDGLWKGDVLADPKPPDTTRILFHNIRGMQVDQTTTLDILSHDQNLLTVDLQGISEHQLDTNQHPLISALQSNLRRSYPGQSTLQIDSSASSALYTYKPGGTAIIAVGDIVGRFESGGKGGDPMGQRSFLHLRRRDMPPLTVISAYQVCPQPTNPKGNTAWHQQRLALNLARRHHTHPRKAFQQFQRQNHDIILGGDFNETLDATNSGLLKIATGCNLMDPWLLRHPGHGPFKTQATGSKRIDSVLMSHRLLDSARSIGYGPFGFITNSNHRPLFLDFHMRRLFGDAVDMMASPQFRGVKSNDRQSVTT